MVRLPAIPSWLKRKSGINKKGTGGIGAFLSFDRVSGVWRGAVFHKQRQLIARFQIVGIAVPAHHIAMFTP
jgi:hypothetical protein